MVESGNVKLVQVIWILYCNDIASNKRSVADEILPVLAFNVELLHCLMWVNIATGSYRNNVRVFCEGFKQNWAVVVIFSIFVEVQFD